MKKIFQFTLLLLITFTFSSCLLTLYPIYAEKDVVFQSDLVGHYTKQKNNEKEYMDIESLSTFKGELTPAVEAIRNKGYLVTSKDEHQQIFAQFIAFTVKLNGQLYIDFFPLHKQDRDEFFEAMLLPMHAVYRVRSTNNKQLVMQQFSSGFLSGLIEQKKIRIKHETLYHQQVITAPTPELQQYIVKYGDRTEAYEDEPDTYTKN